MLAQRGRQALADRLELLVLPVLKGMLAQLALLDQPGQLEPPGLLDSRVTMAQLVRRAFRASKVSKALPVRLAPPVTPELPGRQVTLAPRGRPQLWPAQLAPLDQRGLREAPALPALPEPPRRWLGLPALPGPKATTDLPDLKGFRVFRVKLALLAPLDPPARRDQ